MLLPSPITNPWAGNGSTNARTRNAASATVTDAARHVADLEPAPISKRPPSEMQITDCTASLCAARRRSTPLILFEVTIREVDSRNRRGVWSAAAELLTGNECRRGTTSAG